MKPQPIGRTKQAGQLRIRGRWVCLLAGLIVVAQAGRPGAREGFGQSAPPQQAVAAQDASESTEGASTQIAVPESRTKQEIHVSASDERKKKIADESASLLNLANNLKAEVDKTTKDTLSVTVVGEAGEIEQLAHKMRMK